MKQKIFTLLVMVMVAMTASAVSGFKLTKGTNPHGTTTIKVGDAEAEYAAKGATVTIVVAPEEGHSIATVYGVLYTSWDGAKTRGLQVGERIVATKVKDADNTYSFTMPEYNVEISVSYIEAIKIESNESENEEKNVDNVQVSVEVAGETEIVNGQVIVPVKVNNIIVPNQSDATETNKKDITVEIPLQRTGADGVIYKIVGIEEDTFKSEGSDVQVTKVILPQTDDPISIANGAMKPDGRVLEVVTPLSLLDDYSTMPALKENFEAEKISATVTAPNKYWTFSSGVDCILPEGVTAYKAVWTDNNPRIVELTKDELDLGKGKRGVKANNGVLIASEKGNAYEIVANPGNQDTNTKLDPDKDANSYDGNCLIPTIEAYNYMPASNYLILKDNTFHTMSGNGKVPACKAVFSLVKANAK